MTPITTDAELRAAREPDTPIIHKLMMAGVFDMTYSVSTSQARFCSYDNMNSQDLSKQDVIALAAELTTIANQMNE